MCLEPALSVGSVVRTPIVWKAQEAIVIYCCVLELTWRVLPSAIMFDNHTDQMRLLFHVFAPGPKYILSLLTFYGPLLPKGNTNFKLNLEFKLLAILLEQTVQHKEATVVGTRFLWIAALEDLI